MLDRRPTGGMPPCLRPIFSTIQKAQAFAQRGDTEMRPIHEQQRRGPGSVTLTAAILTVARGPSPAEDAPSPVTASLHPGRQSPQPAPPMPRRSVRNLWRKRVFARTDRGSGRFQKSMRSFFQGCSASGHRAATPACRFCKKTGKGRGMACEGTRLTESSSKSIPRPIRIEQTTAPLRRFGLDHVGVSKRGQGIQFLIQASPCPASNAAIVASHSGHGRTLTLHDTQSACSISPISSTIPCRRMAWLSRKCSGVARRKASRLTARTVHERWSAAFRG